MRTTASLKMNTRSLEAPTSAAIQSEDGIPHGHDDLKADNQRNHEDARKIPQTENYQKNR